MFKLVLVITLVIIGCKTQEYKPGWGIVGNPLAHYRPCNNSDKVSVAFESGLAPGEENQYTMFVAENLPKNTRARLKFDSEASLTLGYFDDLILGSKASASVSLNTPDQSCGRRKVDFTKLIVNGQPTKPGDWPWHVALYRLNGAILGKYNLIGGDISAQERESEAVFNDYIQPACLWDENTYKRLPSGKIFGTMLTSQKFCAGYTNGTSACNGDSGGGFVVFVPDTSGDAADNATGAWHLRGVVSTSAARRDAPICDPNTYVLFTD
ncbi:Hemolymph proteinase 16, partial [Operophtera brumata]